MTSAASSSDLLKHLQAAGASQQAMPARSPASGAAVGEPDFAELLSKARSGDLVSNRPVEIAPGVEITLSTEQASALAVAADRAEAAGLERAVIMLDDKRLVLDVAERTIVEAASARTPGVLTQIDGLVALGVPDEQARAPAPTPPSAGILGNPSLRALLDSERSAA